jgi:hypothetical protein
MSIVTIGTLAVEVLSMASETVLKAAVGELIKDSYKALKAKLMSSAGSDIAILEEASDPRKVKTRIANEIDKQSPQDLSEVRDLARALIGELEKKPPVGVDIGRVKAIRAELNGINVTEGIGFRAEEVETSGDFVVRNVTVGSPRGKSKR